MSSLQQIIIAHHDQARHMARRTLRQKGGHSSGFEDVRTLKKAGRKFTTRVERRLRDLEIGF